MRQPILRTILQLSFLVIVAGCGPVGPVPGGALSGRVQDMPQSCDFLADIEVVQLETDGPYSVNI